MPSPAPISGVWIGRRIPRCSNPRAIGSASRPWRELRGGELTIARLMREAGIEGRPACCRAADRPDRGDSARGSLPARRLKVLLKYQAISTTILPGVPPAASARWASGVGGALQGVGGADPYGERALLSQFHQCGEVRLVHAAEDRRDAGDTDVGDGGRTCARGCGTRRRSEHTAADGVEDHVRSRRPPRAPAGSHRAGRPVRARQPGRRSAPPVAVRRPRRSSGCEACARGCPRRRRPVRPGRRGPAARRPGYSR